MRTYKHTHPWLTFQLDLRKARPQLWMMLGEAQSKCEHITKVPLRPQTAQELHQVYLAKGVQATTAIEGNTLSEQEVQDRIAGKRVLPPSREYLGQEIDNIIEAFNWIHDRLFKGQSTELTVDHVKEFNRLVLKNLPREEDVRPGMIRTRSVGVGRYRGDPAEDCEHLLFQLCQWLNGEAFRHFADYAMAFSVLKAIIAHLYLAWIHPFDDGNGRTARLVELQILLAASVPTPAAHLLSNHYNQTRQAYYRQLDYTSRSGGDVFPFIEYALQGFVDGLKTQLEMIQGQQWDVEWHNYIHERFRDKDSVTQQRQRHLALDLSHYTFLDPVPLSRLRDVSGRIARAYANKTDKTLARDVHALAEMGLVERTSQGVRPKREIILAFLPPRRIDNPANLSKLGNS